VQVTAVDRDEQAIAARTIWANMESRQFFSCNFADYEPDNVSFDGVVADLGVSSYHLDASERGFSFQLKARLRYGMDRRQSLTAAEIINHWDETQLADIFFKYGEERLSRRIARRVQQRPFHTTNWQKRSRRRYPGNTATVEFTCYCLSSAKNCG